jgi:hypothetical protein
MTLSGCNDDASVMYVRETFLVAVCLNNICLALCEMLMYKMASSDLFYRRIFFF